MTDWTLPPYPGERWQRGREIRTVSDRSLGGDVLYYTGSQRRTRYQCSSVRWHDWQSGATKLEDGTPITSGD